MFKRLGIIIGVVAVALIFIFVLMNQDNSNSPVAIDALDRGSLRAAVHSGVPSMGYHQYMDEDLEGFEIDLAGQLAGVIFGSDNLVELKDASSKTALYMLSNNDVDCVIATQVDGKDSSYAYSSSYYTDTIQVVYKDGSFSGLSAFDKDQKIGVITGSAAASMLEEQLEELDHPPQLVTLESYPDARDWLELGKIDAFCASNVFLGEMESYSSFDLGTCDYVVVVRKKDTELLEKIDSALDTLRQNGTLNELITKWL